jgi:hypothetical protein
MPAVRGLIERRLLVNYRVDANVMRKQLPPPFRPKLTPDGSAMAGICLIRLSGIRPPLVPGAFGIRSENAAHRITVEWDSPAGTQEGVFIPRRDSSSRVNVLVGGRLFRGVHHRARFQVREDDRRYCVELHSLDGAAHALVDGRVAVELPAGSVFPSVQDASAFFERGSLGYSATSPGALRRTRVAQLRLASATAGGRCRCFELLRKRNALPTRFGSVRLRPAHARHRP